MTKIITNLYEQFFFQKIKVPADFKIIKNAMSVRVILFPKYSEKKCIENKTNS